MTPEPRPEVTYAVRRRDGQPVDGDLLYGWLTVTGPEDWPSADDLNPAGPPDTAFELVRMTIEPLAVRTWGDLWAEHLAALEVDGHTT